MTRKSDGDGRQHSPKEGAGLKASAGETAGGAIAVRRHMRRLRHLSVDVALALRLASEQEAQAATFDAPEGCSKGRKRPAATAEKKVRSESR
jgi:hypothetical protein